MSGWTQYSQFLLQAVAFGILGCKEKMHLGKLSLLEIDYYIECFCSLKGMWYASNTDLMAVEIEPISVHAVISLYKLAGFIFF